MGNSLLLYFGFAGQGRGCMKIRLTDSAENSVGGPDCESTSWKLLFALGGLRGQIALVAEFRDLVQLRLQPVGVLFLVLEQLDEEIA